MRKKMKYQLIIPIPDDKVHVDLPNPMSQAADGSCLDPQKANHKRVENKALWLKGSRMGVMFMISIK